MLRCPVLMKNAEVGAACLGGSICQPSPSPGCERACDRGELAGGREVADDQIGAENGGGEESRLTK